MNFQHICCANRRWASDQLYPYPCQMIWHKRWYIFGTFRVSSHQPHPHHRSCSCSPRSRCIFLSPLNNCCQSCSIQGTYEWWQDEIIACEGASNMKWGMPHCCTPFCTASTKIFSHNELKSWLFLAVVGCNGVFLFLNLYLLHSYVYIAELSIRAVNQLNGNQVWFNFCSQSCLEEVNLNADFSMVNVLCGANMKKKKKLRAKGDESQNALS